MRAVRVRVSSKGSSNANLADTRDALQRFLVALAARKLPDLFAPRYSQLTAITVIFLPCSRILNNNSTTSESRAGTVRDYLPSHSSRGLTEPLSVTCERAIARTILQIKQCRR